MATPFDSTKAKEIVDILERGGPEADAIVNAFKRLDFEFTRVSTKARQWGDNLDKALETIVETRKKQALLESGLSRMNNEQKALYQSVVKTTGGYDLSSKIQEEMNESANNLKYALEQQAKLQATIDAKQQEMLVTSGDVKDALMEEVRALEEQKKVSGKIVELEKERFKTAKLTQSVLKSKEFIFKELNIPSSFKEMLSQTFDRFKEIDKVTTQVRQQFGLFRKDAEGLEKQIRDTSVDLAHFGVSATDVANTISTVGKNFSYISGRNSAMVKDITVFSKQMGISADTSAKFLKTIGGVSGKSAESKTNMLSMAGAAAKAYGVGLEDVMNEVADASDDVRMFAGKNADEMVRAAAQARQMGTTLTNMAATAKGLLNFESSIQNELKASALIGKNINFNEARRLAFQGKVVEANKVILDQAKKIKFNQLNPLAQEAFAQAAGKSVKELQDMLEAETRIKDALKSQDPEVRKLAEERLKEQKALKDNPKLAQQKYEQDLKSKSNQERMATLQNKINQQLQKFMLPVLEAITIVMDKIVDLFEKLKPEELIQPFLKIRMFISLFQKDTYSVFTIFSKIKNAISGTTQPLQESVTLTKKIGDAFRKFGSEISPVTNSIKSGVSIIGTKISNIFKLVTEGISNFRTKTNNILKSITSGVSNVGSKIGNLFKPVTSAASGFGKLVTGVFKPVTSAASGFGKLVTGVFKPITPIISGFGKLVTGVFKPILGLFGTLGKVGAGAAFGWISKIGPLFGTVAKFLGPIGILITVVQGVAAFIKGFTETTGSMGDKITAGLKGVFKSLILEPLEMAWGLIKKIPGFLAEVDFGAIYKDITTGLLDAFVKLPDMFESLFTGKGGGGGKPIEWGKIFKNVGSLLVEILIFSFYKLPKAILIVVGKLGLLLVKGLVAIGPMLYEALISAFKSGWEWITSFFGGKSPSKLGLSIVNGIVSIGSMLLDGLLSPYKLAWSVIKKIFTTDTMETVLSTLTGLVVKVFDIVTAPYKMAWNLIKSIFTIEMLSTILSTLNGAVSSIFDSLVTPFKLGFDFIKSTLESVKPIISEIGTLFGNVFSTAFNGVLKGLELVWEKIKGIGGFIMDVVGKGISLVTNIVGGGTTEPTKAVGEPGKTPVGNELVDAIVNSNRLVVEKLDKLTQLMSSGQIAVYIDGQKANQLLAASSNKFGSLGQATTF
jgi:phage-related protein